MLIIRRREGESISIGDEIEIEIVELGPARVKIGIRAPREVPVRRKEIATVRDRNLAAAAIGPEGGVLLVSRFRHIPRVE